MDTESSTEVPNLDTVRLDLTVSPPEGEEYEYVMLLRCGAAGTLEAPRHLVVRDRFTYPARDAVGPRVDQVTTRLALMDDGRYRIKSLTVENNSEAGYIDLEDVRRLRYRERIRQALAHVVRMVLADGTAYTATNPLPDPDPAWMVVTVYATALALGQPPVLAVAEHLGLTRDQAAKRVMAARRAGLLGETTAGKAGI